MTWPSPSVYLHTKSTHRTCDSLVADVLAFRIDIGNSRLCNHGPVSIFTRQQDNLANFTKTGPDDVRCRLQFQGLAYPQAWQVQALRGGGAGMTSGHQQNEAREKQPYIPTNNKHVHFCCEIALPLWPVLSFCTLTTDSWRCDFIYHHQITLGQRADIAETFSGRRHARLGIASAPNIAKLILDHYTPRTLA
jgi:hypothetical protein